MTKFPVVLAVVSLGCGISTLRDHGDGGSASGTDAAGDGEDVAAQDPDTVPATDEPVKTGIATPGDRDGDGVPNGKDNCPEHANIGQVDRDDDGTGDVCDLDVSVQDRYNSANCPFAPQRGVNDRDDDGVPDACDLCPDTAGSDDDVDLDGLGVVCDGDDDGDGVEDGYIYVDEGGKSRPDNCHMVYNPDQTDADHDGIGDACDCPLFPWWREQRMYLEWCKEREGIAHMDFGWVRTHDGDHDKDGVIDLKDNCPGMSDVQGVMFSNPDQADADHDGIGDACDSEPKASCTDGYACNPCPPGQYQHWGENAVFCWNPQSGFWYRPSGEGAWTACGLDPERECACCGE